MKIPKDYIEVDFYTMMDMLKKDNSLIAISHFDTKNPLFTVCRNRAKDSGYTSIWYADDNKSKYFQNINPRRYKQTKKISESYYAAWGSGKSVFYINENAIKTKYRIINEGEI